MTRGNAVLLHGLGQTASAWEPVRARLTAPVTAHCPELLALPEGQAPLYTNLYNTFAAWCDALDAPPVLCGLSLGGILALDYAIRNPARVRALVLIGTQYVMPKALLRVQNAVYRLLPERAFAAMGLGKRDCIALSRSMYALDFRQGLPTVRCPALVVCGERDRANLSAARSLSGLLPDGRLAILPEAGHAVNTDAPDALAQLLDGFFAQLEA